MIRLLALGLILAAAPVAAEVPGVVRNAEGLEVLAPDLVEGGVHLAPGPIPFQHRLVFSPGFGLFGAEPLYALRVAYQPDAWLGYEAAIEHNPGESVHAVMHSLSAILRRPRPGRWQPFLSAGYGMVMVHPGESLNADPVTKNAVSAGGGLELFLRRDLALRADLRVATVFGRERDREGVVTYSYLHQAVGLSFHRSVTP